MIHKLSKNQKEGNKSMKTITLDYDLYKQELAAEFKKGAQRGIYEATEYVKNPGTYCLDKAVHYYERERLDEVVAYRNAVAFDNKLQKLIDDETLTVFNHDIKSEDSVIEFTKDENENITLYVGLGR